MRHAATKNVFSYWLRLRGVRVAPERDAINPIDIGRHLADILLLEKSEDGQFRFRIAGSRICALFGQELRGEKMTATVIPHAEADLVDMLGIVTGDALPVIAGVSALTGDRNTLDGELLLLPLTHNGRTDDRLLGILTFNTDHRLLSGTCFGLDILSFRVLGEQEPRFFHPLEPDLPMEARATAARRGHLTVLDGGLS